jgi:hypothetical protein
MLLVHRLVLKWQLYCWTSPDCLQQKFQEKLMLMFYSSYGRCVG